jgi:hypothetical protein
MKMIGYKLISPGIYKKIESPLKTHEEIRFYINEARKLPDDILSSELIKELKKELNRKDGTITRIIKK